MLNPKGKAKELVEKYQFNGDMIDDVRMSEESAIESALICVDEMIKELTEEISPSVHGFRHNYWKEVKQEINKL